MPKVIRDGCDVGSASTVLASAFSEASVASNGEAHRTWAHWEVPADLGAVAAIRAAVVRTVRDWDVALGRDSFVDLKLCASELITNAIVHTGGPCTVTIRWVGKRLRVQIADCSLRLPRFGNEVCPDTGGRGLALVVALTQDFGWYPSGAGKVVWFELGVESPLDSTERFAALVRTANERVRPRTPGRGEEVDSDVELGAGGVQGR